MQTLRQMAEGIRAQADTSAHRAAREEGGGARVRGVPAHSNTSATAKNIQRKGGEDDREQKIKHDSPRSRAGLTHEHKN